MAAPVAIAVYSLAFLILILYTIDAIVQWRNPRGESWKYFSVQVILIICIFIGEVVLVVCNEKEVKPAILHGLQALSLLLSLIIDAMMSSRLYLGHAPLLDFRRHFPWVFFFMSLAVLALFWLAFAFILRGDHEERSLIFVAVAAITAHCFPACFSLSRLHAGNALMISKVSTFVLGLNLATLPASVAALLLPGVTEVLLGQTVISFISNTLWVSLMIYNFEMKEEGAYNTGSDREQGMQGSEVYLPTTSEGDENKSTNVVDPGLWRTESVDNCVQISGDLELYGQG